jgi:hypothetical protein
LSAVVACATGASYGVGIPVVVDHADDGQIADGAMGRDVRCRRAFSHFIATRQALPLMLAAVAMKRMVEFLARELDGTGVAALLACTWAGCGR